MYSVCLFCVNGDARWWRSLNNGKSRKLATLSCAQWVLPLYFQAWFGFLDLTRYLGIYGMKTRFDFRLLLIPCLYFPNPSCRCVFVQGAIPFWDEARRRNECVAVCVWLPATSYKYSYNVAPDTVPCPPWPLLLPLPLGSRLARIWIWILSRFMADDNFPLITVNSSIARSEVARFYQDSSHRLRLGHTHAHLLTHSFGVEFFGYPKPQGPPLFISLCIHLPS